MDILKICILGVLVTVLGMMMKQIRAEYVVLLGLVTCMVIFAFLLMKIQGLVDSIQVLATTLHLETKYIKLLLKITGIAYVSEFSGDLCRDGGMATVANQIGVFGKISILYISLPVFEEVFEIIAKIS